MQVVNPATEEVIIDVLTAEVPDMPIAGDAHLRKGEDPHAPLGRFADKSLDDGEVMGLVIGAVLELHAAATKLGHGIPSDVQAPFAPGRDLQ